MFNSSSHEDEFSEGISTFARDFYRVAHNHSNEYQIKGDVTIPKFKDQSDFNPNKILEKVCDDPFKK